MAEADAFLITTGFAFLQPTSPPMTPREHVEAWIEAHLSAADALVLALDFADGDCDLEDNADFEPDNDNEPSLGWTSDIDQRRAVKTCAADCRGDGSRTDMEYEHDGREPDEDLEPSLGWTLTGARGESDDREEDKHAVEGF